MDNAFDTNEKLYRAVFPPSKFPNFWKKNGKISSAALKKNEGLSVERDDFRPSEEVINSMREVFDGSIVSIKVGQCYDVGALVKYCPSKRSKYHSEIHRNEETARLTDSQAKRLADLAEIEYNEV